MCWNYLKTLESRVKAAPSLSTAQRVGTLNYVISLWNEGKFDKIRIDALMEHLDKTNKQNKARNQMFSIWKMFLGVQFREMISFSNWL